MTNPKIEEIKNNQFARACADDGRLPKWHYEIDYLLGEVERLNAAVKERDDFIYVRGKHVIELADKNDTLRAVLKDAKDALEFYGDRAHWFMKNVDGRADSICPADCEEWETGYTATGIELGGKRAREAIKKIEGVLNGP